MFLIGGQFPGRRQGAQGVGAVRSVFSEVALRESLLHNLKLEVKFFTSEDRREIELPKLSSEAERRPTLIEIHQKLYADSAPEIRETHARRQRFEFSGCIKRKGCA